mgnify:CR=1 FL=1
MQWPNDVRAIMRCRTSIIRDDDDYLRRPDEGGMRQWLSCGGTAIRIILYSGYERMWDGRTCLIWLLIDYMEVPHRRPPLINSDACVGWKGADLGCWGVDGEGYKG